jgi:putative ABC transport system permease protein
VIVSASIRALARRPLRAALALVGVAVSSALLLDMTMMATGLTRSFEDLVGARGYAIRVAPRGTLPFDSEAGIRNASHVQRTLEATPGVRDVAPVLGARMYRVHGDSLVEPISTSGVVAASQFLYDLVQGGDAAEGEVVVSRPLAETLGLLTGDTLHLAAEIDVTLGRPRSARPFVVSGIADFLYDYAGQRSVAMPIAQVQRFTRRQDQASVFAVATSDGADEAVVAAAIQHALPEVSTYSTGEMMAEMNRRLLYFQQLATILGTVALVVTALLISTIVSIGVRERFGEIATLRAIGVRRRRILTSICAEGFALAMIGSLLGLPLGAVVARWLDRILLAFPGIPANVSFFVWDVQRVTLSLALIVAAGALAGLVPGWSAVRAPLGRALREEAE